MARGRKGFATASCVLLGLTIALSIWRMSVEANAYFAPSVAQCDLSPLLAQNTPNYRVLFMQTGLGKPAIDALWNTLNGKNEILDAQKEFFRQPQYQCLGNSPISCEEVVRGQDGKRESAFTLRTIQKGDILLTPCSHTFGWRNGHAALVVDADEGKTLESVVLGTDSSVQNLKKWQAYPQVLVLRLHGVSAEVRGGIADWAMQHLNNIPYHLTVGIFSPKKAEEGQITGTQCAHLVWQAYAAMGYDIDGDGGKIVTPDDISKSSILEVVQAYGIDMTRKSRRGCR